MDRLIGWQYLDDLNELNEVLNMTEEERSEIMGLDGVSGVEDLVSVTYDTHQGCYLAIWKCRYSDDENGGCGMISDKLTTDDGEPDGTGGQIFCP